MRKSKVLVSLAAAALLSVGVGTIGQQDNVFTPQSVQAAKKTYKIKLKKNAKVFNKRGKRKGKKLLKKGHTYTTYGKKTIHGKKYYHLSKGRYIKAVNAKKVTKKSQKTSMKTFSVTVNTPAKVYNAQGKSTGTTLNKGAVELAQGTKTIKGKKYYKIGNNHYILQDSAKLSDVTVPTNSSTAEPSNSATSTGKTPSKTDDKEDAEINGEPTQKHIKGVLANGGVYFTDSQVKQIQNLLWQKIQDYRISKGYDPYKSDAELDNVISNANDDFDIADTIAQEDYNAFGKYVPNLAQNGITSMYGIDNWDYYDATSLDNASVYFNFKDRDPEHVATSLFNSLKDNPEYSRRIEGHKDKYAFGTLALHYYWNGNFSSLGLIFVEVNGNGAEWVDHYNAN